MKDLTKRLLVVTGGTKGIGRAVIEQFIQHDFDIITCARNKDDLEKLISQYDGTVSGLAVDLSEKSGVDAFISFIQQNGKTVDVLVNNAGIFIPGLIHEEPDGTLEKLMNTNLYSGYHLTRGLVREMKAKGQGHIFNICSIASMLPYNNGGSYSITKYAQLGFSKSLREEMKTFGIRVTAVLPGATYTSSWEGAGIEEEKFIKAEDIASAIYNAYTLKGGTVEEILIRPDAGDL